MARLTKEFPSHLKPVYRGVYKTEFAHIIGYSRWTGSRWANQRDTITAASKAPHIGAVQNKRWCGLAEKPE